MRRFAANLTGRLTRMGLNGPPGARKLTAFLLGAIDDRCSVATPHGGLTFRVSNPLERWRADTLLDKEPETIAWLDRTIGPDSLLYDVGANVGLYALYAAHICRGRTKVVAFEPEALNFARLYQNIFDNGLSKVVGALPLALGCEKGVARLNLSSFEAGRARHVVAPAAAEGTVSEWLVAGTIDDTASMLGTGWDCPTHLKIDVDGPELDVLAGARGLLGRQRVKHVLVELSADSADEGGRILRDLGFRLTTVGLAQDGWANHIFARGETA